MSDRRAKLREIPSIDRLLASSPLKELAAACPHVLLRDAAQQAVAEVRQAILEEKTNTLDCSLDAIAVRAAELTNLAVLPSLRRVINVTGTLLHTNLGRAPMSTAAIEAAAANAENVSSTWSHCFAV